MGAEFNMTLSVVALAQGKDIDTKPLVINPKLATLYSDAVCAAIVEVTPE